MRSASSVGHRELCEFNLSIARGRAEGARFGLLASATSACSEVLETDVADPRGPDDGAEPVALSALLREVLEEYRDDPTVKPL